MGRRAYFRYLPRSLAPKRAGQPAFSRSSCSYSRAWIRFACPNLWCASDSFHIRWGLGVTIGWAPEILKIGNWDQVLFLSFIPFVLLRIRLSAFQTSRIQGILGLGICLGAATVAYTEGAALSGAIYLPLLIWRLLR
jgi:hypothetical protein